MMQLRAFDDILLFFPFQNSRITISRLLFNSSSLYYYSSASFRNPLSSLSPFMPLDPAIMTNDRQIGTRINRMAVKGFRTSEEKGMKRNLIQRGVIQFIIGSFQQMTLLFSISRSPFSYVLQVLALLLFGVKKFQSLGFLNFKREGYSRETRLDTRVIQVEWERKERKV